MTRLQFHPIPPKVKRPKQAITVQIGKAHIVWNESIKAVVCLECMEGTKVDYDVLLENQKCGFIKSAGQIVHDKIESFSQRHWLCGEQVVVKT